MSTDVSYVRAACRVREMVEEARTSETSVDIRLRTRQYIPEDSELHTRRRENFKSHRSVVVVGFRSCVVASGDTDVSEKHAVLIFRAEVTKHGSGGLINPQISS
jgi:hypothetical protein